MIAPSSFLFEHNRVVPEGQLMSVTNTRTDAYGGSLENRMRFPLAVFDAGLAAWPAHKPMSARISATDWAPGGVQPDDAVEVARLLKAHGCDIVDVSAGQTVPEQRPRDGRLFQTPFADRIPTTSGWRRWRWGTSRRSWT